MRRIRLYIFLFFAATFGCVAMTLLSAIIQLWHFPSIPMASLWSGLVAYLIVISAISTWLANIMFEKFIRCSRPLTLETINSFIAMAKEAGLLSEDIASSLMRMPSEKWSLKENSNLNVNSEVKIEEVQIRAEMQCEIELLLSELHWLLISSWFDNVSPKDPDFPSVTRQALTKVANELQQRAKYIMPREAAQITLMLFISHVHKVQNKLYNMSSMPAEDGSAEQLLELISDALISKLALPEICSALGGRLLSSLLAYGALLHALTIVSCPGWLSLQVAQAITRQSIVSTAVYPVENILDEATTDNENLLLPENPQTDIEPESVVQEACTPADDPPDYLMWSSELTGCGPRLWGTCSLQPEQPSLPQIIEPGGGTAPVPVLRKASEAEWLNPSPPRQQFGLQLSKSSQDLRQISTLQFPAEDLKNIKKELSLGSFVREETSMFSHRMREAGSDVLGSLRARASSHLSALLSPARETSALANSSPAESLLEPDEGEDEMSPVYEEASDLATSIAKLRALLKHHDHKSSTDDDEPAAVQSLEAGSQSYEPVTWDIHHDVDTPESDWMEAEEAPELPEDGRPIMNICIPATELSCDADGQQFVQYCIQYDAVYVQEGVEGPRLVLQTTTVKRRFQEFLNLQNRLEENDDYRSALRAVKGPSRWLSLAFSKAGHQTTAARLPVLERFLQQLSEQPLLARSSELQNFLAYGSEQAIAFPKQEHTDLPRLDKIFARTVSGVFHSIKTALPSFDFELSPASSLQQLQHGIPFNTEEVRSSTLPGFLGFVGNRPHPRSNQAFNFKEKVSQGRDISRDIQKYLASRIETASDALIDQTTQKTGYLTAEASFVFPSELNWQSNSLSNLLEDLLELVFPRSWINNGALPLALRTLLQEWTEEKLQILAEDSWSLKSAVICLRICRAALAPGNSVRIVSRDEGQAALRNALNKCIPGWMHILIGSSDTEKLICTLNKTLYEECGNQQLLLNLCLAVTYAVLAVPNTSRNYPITQQQSI